MQILRQVAKCNFASYESLITQISAAHNYKTVLSLYSNNKELFKNEHLVLSLRMLGRHARNISLDDEDPAIHEITQQINNIVDDLSEFDVVDVVFWLRKFKECRIKSGVTHDTYVNLFKKVDSMIESKQLAFRNLVNLYYDYSHLNQNTDALTKELLNQLKSQQKQNTPFINIQILQAIAHKSTNQGLYSRDKQIFEQILNGLEANIEDYDLDQKTQAFKLIALMNHQNQAPRFQVPKVMKLIKQQLVDGIDQLNEDGVVNIFVAYQHLPRYFDNDLFNELKALVISTLEQNGNNFKTNFILNSYQAIVDQNNKKIDVEFAQKLQGELVNRIKTFQLSSYQIMRTCKLSFNLPKNQELLDLMLEKINELYNYQSVIEYLFKHQADLSAYIKQEASKQQNVKNTLLIYLIASRDQPESAELLRPQVQEIINTRPQHAIYLLSQFEFQTPAKFQLQDETYLMFVEHLKQKKLDLMRYAGDLVKGCASNKSRLAALPLLESHIVQGNSRLLFNRLLDSYEDFNFDSFLLLLHVLQKDITSVSLEKLKSLIDGNLRMVQGIIRSDFLNRFLHIVTQTFTAIKQTEHLKLHHIANIFQIFENSSAKSLQTKSFLIRIRDHYHSINGQVRYNDNSFLQLLVSNGCVTAEQAQIELEEPRIQLLLKARLCQIALQSSTVKENTITVAAQIKAKLVQQLGEHQDFKKLKSVTGLLALGDMTEEEVENFKNIIIQLKPKMSVGYYLDLVENCNNQKIQKELINMFQLISEKLDNLGLITVLEKFIDSHNTNIHLFNKFIELYGERFQGFYPEHRIRTLIAFTNARLKQVDFFVKNLERVAKQGNQFRSYTNQIIDSVFRLGLIEPEVSSLIIEIVKNVRNDFHVVPLLNYLAIANVPIAEIDALLSGLSQPTEIYQTYGLSLALDYYKRYHPESGATKYLQANHGDKEEQTLSSFKQKPSAMLEQFEQYFKAMKVEAVPKHAVENVIVDFYLPETKTIVNILQQSQINYDRTTFSGNILLLTKIQEKLANNVISLNFKEFVTQKDPANKINYLIQKGIQCNTQDIDYASLPQQQNKEQEQ